MQALTDLTDGIKFLEPFLLEHGFEPGDYEHHKHQNVQFIGATYTDGPKSFHIEYKQYQTFCSYKDKKGRLFTAYLFVFIA